MDRIFILMDKSRCEEERGCKKKNLNGIWVKKREKCGRGGGVKDLNRYNMGLQEGLGFATKFVRIPARKGTKAAVSFLFQTKFRVKSFHNVCLLSPSSFPLERATRTNLS